MLQSFGLGEPNDALPRLFGGRNIVCGVTLGGAGVVWFDGQRLQSAPSPKVKAVDTLAAGDTWHGAFALALAERHRWGQSSLQRPLQRANARSSWPSGHPDLASSSAGANTRQSLFCYSMDYQGWARWQLVAARALESQRLGACCLR